jgi:hypothetical protein
MNLNKTIRDLHEELKKLNSVIAAVEEFERAGTLPPPHRRGRKSMDGPERRLVSERMRKYWASQRERQGTAAGSASQAPGS